MRTERKEVPIDSVVPGTALADDVRDAAGSVLLPRGVLVTEATLVSLRRRGIERLWLALPVTLDDAAIAAEVQQIEARQEFLFRNAGDNEASNDLRARLLAYRRSRL